MNGVRKKTLFSVTVDRITDAIFIFTLVTLRPTIWFFQSKEIDKESDVTGT